MGSVFMDAARKTGDIVVPPLQIARTMLSWRVYVGAATENGEMHDPLMQLARSVERISFFFTLLLLLF